MKRKTKPLQQSKDGKPRRTVVVNIRLTEEEETKLDLLYLDHQESIALSNPQSAADMTFEDYLAILLRQKIAEVDDECPERTPE